MAYVLVRTIHTTFTVCNIYSTTYRALTNLLYVWVGAAL